MTFTVILTLVGFYLLVQGADLVIESAVSLGKRFDVSDIAVGLAVVAFGTSLPEFTVNILAAMNGSTDLALGNVLGSNISNILLILGVSALLTPLAVRSQTAFKEVPFAILAAVVVAVAAFDLRFSPGATIDTIGRGDGVLMLGFFAIFLYYIVSVAHGVKDLLKQDGDKRDLEETATGRLIMYLFGGFIGLVVGAKWIVDGAVAVAVLLGVGETVIGLTIVAIGTSLPELAASVAAVRKGKADIVIGNIIGSNIFNTFLILGTTALILPVAIASEHIFPILLNIAITFVLMGFLLFDKRYILTRWSGGLFVAGYIAYLALLVLKQL